MIETLLDWNTRLGYCGCCPMPVCPAPDFVYQLKTGEDSEAFGIFPYTQPAGDPSDLVPSLYKTQTVDFSGFVINGTQQTLERIDDGGGFSREIFQEAIYSDWGQPGGSLNSTRTVYTHENPDTCSSAETPWTPVAISFSTPMDCPGPICSETSWERFSDCGKSEIGTLPLTPQGCPGPFTTSAYTRAVDATRVRHYKLVLSDPISAAELITAATDEMNAEDWGDEAISPFAPRAIFLLTWPRISDRTWPGCGDDNLALTGLILASKRKVRFRFRIPTAHTGSKFWITYDIAEFPADGDPSFFSEDNVVEWTGPGTGASSDPSWLTPWVEIDPPEVPGERRIVNIRYTCYTGTRYGAKPQVMGEAFTPPPP